QSVCCFRYQHFQHLFSGFFICIEQSIRRNQCRCTYIHHGSLGDLVESVIVRVIKLIRKMPEQKSWDISLEERCVVGSTFEWISLYNPVRMLSLRLKDLNDVVVEIVRFHIAEF